jgi:hypothetical protein
MTDTPTLLQRFAAASGSAGDPADESPVRMLWGGEDSTPPAASPTAQAAAAAAQGDCAQQEAGGQAGQSSSLIDEVSNQNIFVAHVSAVLQAQCCAKRMCGVLSSEQMCALVMVQLDLQLRCMWHCLQTGMVPTWLNQ